MKGMKRGKSRPMLNINVARNKKQRCDLLLDKGNKIPDQPEGTKQTSGQSWHMEETQNTQASSYATQNRYTVLGDVTNHMDTDEQADADFVEMLRGRNTQDDGHQTMEASRPEERRDRVESPSRSCTSKDDSQRCSEDLSKEETTQKQESKPPPIHILYQNPKDTEKLLLTKLGQVNFFIKRVNDKKHILQMLTLADFRKAKEILNLVSACYYTYTPKKEKVITILLKGLHHSYEPEDILANLKSYVQLKVVVLLRASQMTGC